MAQIRGGSRIFPRRGATPKNAIIFQIFAENCIKMKEFGPGGGVPGTPLWIRQWYECVSFLLGLSLSVNG